MEDEDYVSYQTALALKAAGFSEVTLGKYVDCPKDPVLFSGMIYEPWNLNEDEILAPSLYDAAKWLRNSEAIDIDIRSTRLTILRYDYMIHDWNKKRISPQYYDTYEEALSAAIEDALNLKNEYRKHDDDN